MGQIPSINIVTLLSRTHTGDVRKTRVGRYKEGKDSKHQHFNNFVPVQFQDSPNKSRIYRYTGKDSETYPLTQYTHTSVFRKDFTVIGECTEV